MRVSIEAPNGTSIYETDKIVRKVEEVVKNSPASLASYTSQTNSGGKGSVTVNYLPYNERKIKGESAQIILKERLKDITGGKISVDSQTGMGGSAISYRVVGDNYSVLGDISDKVMAIINNYDEVKISGSDFEDSDPEFIIEIDRAKAAYYGLTTQAIASTIRSSINGTTVGKFREDEKEYNINIRYIEESRNSIDSLKSYNFV